MPNKVLTAAAWVYSIVFIGSAVAAIGIVSYCAVTGEMINFGGH